MSSLYKGLCILERSGKVSFVPPLEGTETEATAAFWTALGTYQGEGLSEPARALDIIQASDEDTADIPLPLQREMYAVVVEIKEGGCLIHALGSVALDFDGTWVSSIPVGYGLNAHDNAQFIEAQKQGIWQSFTLMDEVPRLTQRLLLSFPERYLEGSPLKLAGKLPSPKEFQLFTPQAYSAVTRQTGTPCLSHPPHPVWTEIILPPAMGKTMRAIDPQYQGLTGIYSLVLEGMQATALWGQVTGQARPEDGGELLIQVIIREQADSRRTKREHPVACVIGVAYRWLDERGFPTGPKAAVTTRHYEDLVPPEQWDKVKRLWQTETADWSSIGLKLWDARALKHELVLTPEGQHVDLYTVPPTPPTHVSLAVQQVNLEKLLRTSKIRWEKHWKALPLADDLSDLSSLGNSAASALSVGLWRKARQVYRIDETVLDALRRDTAPPEKVPTAQLRFLPQEAVYLPLPGFENVHGDPLQGALVALSRDQGQEVVIVTLHGPESELSSFTLPVGEQVDVGETVHSALLCRLSVEQQHLQLDPDPQVLENVMAVLSAALYLCAVGTETARRGSAPAKERKSGLAQNNETWDVGIRLGAALRRAQAEQVESGERKEQGYGQAVKPHLRRAHFHLFRYGPLSLAERPLRLRWLPPIPVKLDLEDVDDQPVTVRPIKA